MAVQHQPEASEFQVVCYTVPRSSPKWTLEGETPGDGAPDSDDASSDQVVQYTVPRSWAGWELSEDTMPSSVLHDEAVELLKAILTFWAARFDSMLVVRNLAVRWDKAFPTSGVDPDVCALSPAPPEGKRLRSLRTWEDGHEPPWLAIEVVSETNPRKDYIKAPDRYAVSGTRELWIFDPLLSGPSNHGGPWRLQVWQRDEQGNFTRVYRGKGPAYSQALGAFLVATDDGRKLRIAEDAEATRLWPTAEEAERAAKDAERAAKETERAAKEAALARIAELERLAGRR